jgi:hypothetical protein
MRKFLSVYSYFFMRIRRIRGKYLSVHGEYGEFRVVCGRLSQNTRKESMRTWRRRQEPQNCVYLG